MKRHPVIGFLAISLIFGFTVAFPIGAQEKGAIDGVIWFNCWEGWELVLRENRFILTDHSNQATFRGTHERDGEYVRLTLDPRKTVFLDGPSEDGENVRYIEELDAARKLPVFFSTSACSQSGGGPPTLSMSVQPDSISLTYDCGGTEIGRTVFQWLFQRIDQDG